MAHELNQMLHELVVTSGQRQMWAAHFHHELTSFYVSSLVAGKSTRRSSHAGALFLALG